MNERIATAVLIAAAFLLVCLSAAHLAQTVSANRHGIAFKLGVLVSDFKKGAGQ